MQLPNFEDEVKEGEDILNTDIKINPDFYIHHALVNAQKSLLKEDIKEGFLQYWGFVEHIEILCKAANMLPDKYTNSLEEFKKTEEYQKEQDNFKKSVKIANKKLSLIMGEVFNRKTVTEPLKIK